MITGRSNVTLLILVPAKKLVQLLFYLFIFYFIYSLIDFYLTNNAKALLSFSLTYFLSLYNLEAFSLSKQQGPPPPPPPISLFHTKRDTVCSNKFWAFGGNVVAMDKDSCGVGFVAELSGESSRKTVIDALKMLVRMTHRGAYGVKPTLEME
eukprot:XP_014625944.1 uncharacterized protein LOC106796846 [Glycine max]